jgi:hypothetical protein
MEHEHLQLVALLETEEKASNSRRMWAAIRDKFSDTLLEMVSSTLVTTTAARAFLRSMYKSFVTGINVFYGSALMQKGPPMIRQHGTTPNYIPHFEA